MHVDVAVLVRFLHKDPDDLVDGFTSDMNPVRLRVCCSMCLILNNDVFSELSGSYRRCFGGKDVSKCPCWNGCSV